MKGFHVRVTETGPGALYEEYNVIPALTENEESFRYIRRLNWVVTPAVGPFGSGSFFVPQQ